MTQGTERQGRRQVLVSWSGGKDSALMLARLREQAEVEVVGLLTTIKAGEDRVSAHEIPAALLRRQAEMLDLPLFEMPVPPDCTNTEYEKALQDALAAAGTRFPGLRRLAFGDIFLEDLRRYREQLAEVLHFEALFPLWGESSRSLAAELMHRGMQARVVCVDTTQLDGSYSGRRYDTGLIADLPGRVDPCGENGEFHTFVSWAPGFRESIAYVVGQTRLHDGRFACCELTPTGG